MKKNRKAKFEKRNTEGEIQQGGEVRKFCRASLRGAGRDWPHGVRPYRAVGFGGKMAERSSALQDGEV